MADEDFEYFLTKLPRNQDGPSCTEEHLDTYRGLLPDALLSYWEEFGFAGFGDGIAWLTDPLEWQHTTTILTAGVTHPDLGGNATYIPYVRTAFGKTYFWTPGFGLSLNVDPVYRNAYATRSSRTDSSDRSIQAFFTAADKDQFDLDWNDTALFDAVVEKVGPLTYDQMYGFVPAVSLGGAATPETAAPFDVHVHLELLKDFAGEWDTSYLNF